MKKLACMAGLLAGLGLALIVGACGAANDAPKYSTKEVMAQAHGKEGLKGKVASGKASKEEKEQLVVLYVALAKNKPAKGDDTSWKQKTEAIVKAAKAVASSDDKAAVADLNKATNCKVCHEAHKSK